MGVDLDDLLAKTSRTFALAIPLLPEPTRRSVSLAYLVLRIADTFEDATRWPRAERITALGEFGALLASPSRAEEVGPLVRRWCASPPVDDRAYLELLGKTPEVLAEVDALPPRARAIVVRHASRTIDGMAMVVARADERGDLRLGSLGDLKDYCYLVAGIVGEMLTDLFVEDAPSLAAELPTLSRTMAALGEGLQLVNILKDAKDDAHHGRVYLPKDATRAEVLALARRDLELGSEYLSAIQRGRAPRGVVGFVALLLTLARASLDRLEAHGPGAKVPRDEVVRLYDAIVARDGAASRFASRT